MPIRQYLYFDAIECLPECEYKPLIPTEKSRYYSQEIIFGKDFQQRLGVTKYFLVCFYIIYAVAELGNSIQFIILIELKHIFSTTEFSCKIQGVPEWIYQKYFRISSLFYESLAIIFF